MVFSTHPRRLPQHTTALPPLLCADNRLDLNGLWRVAARTTLLAMKLPFDIGDVGDVVRPLVPPSYADKAHPETHLGPNFDRTPAAKYKDRDFLGRVVRRTSG
jgi:hypothetical protein